MQSERIAKDEQIRALEIARNKAVDAAEIAAREAVEAARIAQDKVLASERIRAEQETRNLEIARTEVLEAAEIARRDKVERARITTELALEKERIASAKAREVLNIDQKKAVEIAEEDRTIMLSAKRVERADADRALRQAEIVARQEIEKTDVDRERALEAARIERRRAIEQLEVARNQSLQEAEIGAREEVERARIASDRGLDEARIGRERELRKLEVDRERVVESAQMDKAIAIYQKSLEQSAAQVEADNARARAAEAEERVRTVRDSEVAKRRRTVEVMIAEKEAEEKRIAAEAERVRAAVEAEAQKLLNEAENVLTDQARYSLFRRRLLDKIEGIVRESVKPMEKIEGIRILHVDGLAGGGGGGSSRNATDEVIDSALRYRVQAPLIDSILSEIGMEGGSLSKLPGLIREARDLQGIKESTARAAKSEGGGEKPPEGGRGRAGAAGRAAVVRRLRRREGIAMARVYTSSVINARCDRVWARIRDFNGLPNWHPAIAESRIENGEPADKIGCVRDFRLRNGDRIRERLLGLSDHDLFCTYSILESPMGVVNYVATLRLTPVTDGERTFAEWTAEFDCPPEREAELVTNIGTGVFQGGFDALKRAFGG